MIQSLSICEKKKKTVKEWKEDAERFVSVVIFGALWLVIKEICSEKKS